MAENITLTNLVNLQNQTTAVNTINANNTTITNAFLDVLSLSGQQPNSMLSNLDMNSNRILNLPAPGSANEPARLADLNAVVNGGSLTIQGVPTGGTQGQVLAKNSSANYDDSWQIMPILGTTPLSLGSTITTVAGNLTFSGNTSIGGTLNVTGATTLGTVSMGNATFTGSTSFSGAQTFPSMILNSNGLLGGASTQTLKVGSGSGTGDDSAIYLLRTVTPASGLLNSHGIRDESAFTVNVTGNQFSGYSSFDSAFTVNGIATTPQNHIHGYQARQIWGASGHVSDWSGFTAQPTVNAGAGVIDNAYGFQMLGASVINGGITNQYALYGNPMSGANNNWFLYQAGTEKNVLSGTITIGATAPLSVEVLSVAYNSASQFGSTFKDTGSSGTASAIIFNKAGGTVGSITCTSSGTTYGGSSDERLKDFTGDYNPDEAIAIIKANPVRTFNWKKTGESAIGWGAQTSYAVNPDLAIPGNDEANIPWTIDKGARTPYLWAAVSNILERLERLENGTKG